MLEEKKLFNKQMDVIRNDNFLHSMENCRKYRIKCR